VGCINNRGSLDQIRFLQGAGVAVWRNQASGDWGGNLLHLAETRIELPPKLGKAAGRAVRRGLEPFRRRLTAAHSLHPSDPFIDVVDLLSWERMAAEVQDLRVLGSNHFVLGGKFRLHLLQHPPLLPRCNAEALDLLLMFQKLVTKLCASLLRVTPRLIALLGVLVSKAALNPQL